MSGNSFCLIKIWQVHREFKLLLIETNNKSNYPVNNFSKDLNAYTEDKWDTIKGHLFWAICDVTVSYRNPRFWLNTEAQTQRGFGYVETCISPDAQCSQAAALLWLSRGLAALWRSQLVEPGERIRTRFYWEKNQSAENKTLALGTVQIVLKNVSPHISNSRGQIESTANLI